MVLRDLKIWMLFFILAAGTCIINAQESVPLGIYYQAVARDNYGKELASKDIEVKFSIIIGTPIGNTVYEELHSKVTTSKYGVFSLIIGSGTPTGGIYGELSQIQWSKAYHYLRVDVKFENDFIYMGTMQFLAVPYALYAQKSLEPGPAGPKGDSGPKGEPGDPASDNQTISFDQSNLTISNGNSVPLTSLLQNLTITSSPEGNYLGISRGNSVLLATIEADGDPANEIQDLTINSDKLKITKNPLATEWDLTRYLDNTDNQGLSWNAATRVLGISGNANTINLSELKNDADADPTNEIQSLSYNQSANSLSISGGNTVVLGNMVAFRFKKTISESGLAYMTDYDFKPADKDFMDGTGYDSNTGVFTATSSGIYTFVVGFTATGLGDSRSIKVFLNDQLFEVLNSGIVSTTSLTRSVTMKLFSGDQVKVKVNTGTSSESGIGSFAGYRIH
jgi:hypothetical protein